MREPGSGARSQLTLLLSISSATLEVTGQHSSVLLHVENHRPIYSTGKVWAGEAGPEAPCSPLLLKLMTPPHPPLRCSDPFFFFPFPQKRLKAAEADSKLKQVYIPT